VIFSYQHNSSAVTTAPKPTASNEPPKFDAPPVKVDSVLVARPLLAVPKTALVLVFVTATPLMVVVYMTLTRLGVAVKSDTPKVLVAVTGIPLLRLWMIATVSEDPGGHT
jgi:hypothetical protein